MKIGIVTLRLLTSYGGILQAWALQEKLRQMGHKPTTIDYINRPYPSWHIIILSWIKTLLLLCIGKRRPFAKRIYCLGRKEWIERFVSKNMTLTHQVYYYKSRLVTDYGFEAVITGSDQNWRPPYNRDLEDMFLRFVKKADVKKIAYASSFGVDYWEYTPKQTKECARLAKKIDAISVRENSGIALCEKYLGVDAVEVLDPTLLHTAEDYKKLCTDIPKISEPYLAAYVLDITPEKQAFIEIIAKEQGLSVRTFSIDINSKLGIEEWLAIYRDAKYVITDSFHGTVFSILFHKPFLSIVNESRGASRFYSLLHKLDLEDKLITSLNYSSSPSDIDWKHMESKLDALRKDATDFLTKALSK